jgi:hypothetical protein
MEDINTHTEIYGTGADPSIITLGPKVGGHPNSTPYSNKTSMEFELKHGEPVLAPIDMVFIGFKHQSAEYRIRPDGQKDAPFDDLLLYFESISPDWPGMIIGVYHLLSSPLLPGHNQHPDCSAVEEWGSRMQAQGQMFLPDEDRIMDPTGDALSCDALIGHTVKRGELIGFAGSVGTHSMAPFRFKVSHTSENPTVKRGNRYLHWVQPGSFFYWQCYTPDTIFPSGVLAYPFECGDYQLPAEQHKDASAPSSTATPVIPPVPLPGSGLKLISDKEAVCNNGDRATYVLHWNDDPSDKWVVFFEGGGFAASPGQYRSRVKENNGYLVKPEDNANANAGAFVEHMRELGYNIVWVHYCSSDLYQGDHYHEIDGKQVPFKGRRIVQGLIDDLRIKLNAASDIIFAGFSAGSVALGYNADLFAQFENSRVLSDSWWSDTRRQEWRLSNPSAPEALSFLYNNPPDHCGNTVVPVAEKAARCLPNRHLFEDFGLEEVFVIWNLGDPYNRTVGDKSGVAEAIRADLTAYGTGFSIDVDKVAIEGFNGHVMTTREALYNYSFDDGITLKKLVENWVKGMGNSLYIGY